MKSEFWFVDDDKTWQKFFRLKKKRCQSHKTKRTIGNLTNIKNVIFPRVICPIEANAFFIGWNWAQNEIAKLRHNRLDMLDNSVVVFPVFCFYQI